MQLRQLTYKNDPRLSVITPQKLIEQVKAAAKSGKRPHPDEVIRRIGKTFEDNCATEYKVQAYKAKTTLGESIFDIKDIQRFPKEMLEALKESAHQEGHSLDMEVTLRLMVTFQFPQIFVPQDIFKKTKNTRMTQTMINAQKSQHEETLAHYYEYEKLKHFLNYAGRLPKNIKEIFQYIDTNTVGAQILDKMLQDDIKNREKKWNQSEKT